MRLDTLDKKIILTNNLANGRKVIINLNKEKEVVLNYDILTMPLLINSLLDKLAIKNNEERRRMIGDKEASLIIYELIQKGNYGFDKSIFSCDAISTLLELINDYRYQDNLSFKGIYQADYNQLLNDYYAYLDNHNLTDYIYGIKLVNSLNLNAKCLVLDDLELKPIEEKLINNLFGSYEAYNAPKYELNIKGFYQTYGIYNELLNALNIIKENNIAVNDVTILYTDSIYENFLRGLLEKNNIKYSLSGGHAKSTNLVSFILDVLAYIESDYTYAKLEDVLINLGLDDIYLKQFYKTLYFPKVIVGYGYQRTEMLLDSIKEKEEQKDFFIFLTDLLQVCDSEQNINYLGLIDFALKYVLSIPEKKALETKLRNIDYLLQYKKNALDIRRTIIQELESIKYSEKDNEGIELVPLSKTFSLRNHLFVVGLCQNYLIKDDAENPLITDIELYKEELNNLSYIKTLDNKKRSINQMLDYFLSSSKASLYISYPNFNKIDNRPFSPSVYFLNLFNQYNNEFNSCPTSKNDKTPMPFPINLYRIEKEELMMPSKKLEDNKIILDEFSNGDISDLEEKEHLDIEEDNKKELDILPKYEIKSLSPTAILSLVDCPYKFYYQYLRGVTDRQFPRLNPYEWLEANEKGTFFHRIMELYALDAFKEENFKPEFDNDIFEQSFNKALEETKVRNVIKDQKIYELEVKEIKEVAKPYIISVIEREFKNSLYRTIGTEFKIESTGYYYKGIQLRGSVDRVDGYIENNTLHLRLVDYKTGHLHDPFNYIQHIIYSHVLLNSKTKLFKLKYDNLVVDQFVYTYPFDKVEKVFNYDEILFDEENNFKCFEKIDNFVITYLDGMKGYSAKMEQYFNENYSALSSSMSKSICTYCNYKDVCIKRIKEGYLLWKKK